jgi:hypothetical protein
MHINIHTTLRYAFVLIAGISIAVGSASAAVLSSRLESKTVSIELDATSDETVQEVNLSDYQIAPPEECNEPNITCTERTRVVVNIEKTWDITTFEPIDSADLTASEFALYYPRIEAEEVTRTSPVSDILLLQRALYDRGLLDVLPTGRFAAKTERAIMHFQQIKQIDEMEDGRMIAGPQTLKELNAMVDRMMDPEYLLITTPPAFDPSLLSDRQRIRNAEIERFFAAVRRGTFHPGLWPVDQNGVEVLLEGEEGSIGTLLIDGFVRIEEES